MAGRRRSPTDHEVERAVSEAISIADALRRLGLVAAGGNYRTLHRRIADLGLDTRHLLGQAWRTGKPNTDVRRRSLDDLLRVGSRVRSNELKKRLIREGIKRAACERCCRTTWNGRPIPLELDHINGRAEDNRLENLRILCPNCHAQTPTYRGRNIGNSR